MKKLFFILPCIALFQELHAQEPADALRYSWIISSGTARQQAVGGAMASLGGDISATFVNPAGLGFYKTGDFVLTPAFRFLNNKATYFGRTEKDKYNSFSTGVSGIVLGNGENSEENNRNAQGNRTRKKTRSSAFSIAVNRIASFNSRILYRGVNNESSYSQKFLEEIRNSGTTDANNVANNFPYGTSLALNTFWIDTAAGYSAGNRDFVSLAVPLLGTGLIQENKVTSKGGITELALAAAGNTNDKFYYGFTLGIPFLRYEREAIFTEADFTSNATNRFDFATITDNLETTGTGINLKFGVIFKPVEHIRLGVALHSPSFFKMTDVYSASVRTNTENFQGEWTQSTADIIGNSSAEFKYWYFTPYRIMVSGSYVLREIEDVRKQKGFLTADIEFVNYKASSFTTDAEGENDDETARAYLKSLNRAIDRSYKPAFNFKAGGELKFTTVMVRLGGAYYGNPYKDLAGEKGHRFQMTGGLGYRNRGFFVDLTYAHTMGKDVHYAYRLQNSPFSGAAIKNTGGNVLLTVGFKI